LRVAEANYVAGAAGIVLQGSDGVFDAALGEIFQEGIAGAERQEAQRGAAVGFGGWEQTVDDFEGGAVAADCQEISDSFPVGSTRDFGGFAGASGVRDGERDPRFADPFQHAGGSLTGASAAGRGIYDRKKWDVHWCGRSGDEKAA
jgi:hypothetical protein